MRINLEILSRGNDEVQCTRKTIDEVWMRHERKKEKQQHTNTLRIIKTLMQTNKPSYIQKPANKETPTHKHIKSHTHTHTSMYIRQHTHTHTYTYIYTQTHIIHDMILTNLN